MTPLLSTCLLVALAANPESERLISVSGSAEILVPPDVVQLLLAVETSDKTIAKAKAANDDRTAKTLAIVKKFGVEAKDIQTDRLSMEPQYDSNRSYSPTRASEPDGFLVRRSVVVTLRDVKRFEELLGQVLESGANRVDGIEFQVTQLRKHRDAARAMALKAAREKADAMAKELGSKAGRPTSISEGYVGSGMWSWGGGSRGGAQYMQNAMMAAPSRSAEGSEAFAPGQVSITASVNVSFELRDLP